MPFIESGKDPFFCLCVGYDAMEKELDKAEEKLALHGFFGRRYDHLRVNGVLNKRVEATEAYKYQVNEWRIQKKSELFDAFEAKFADVEHPCKPWKTPEDVVESEKVIREYIAQRVQWIYEFQLIDFRR